MSKSLIRKNQLHPDISDLVSGYGAGFFVTPLQLNNATDISQQIITQGAVLVSGNQTISGLKNFVTRLTVNGTGVLLSGEAAQVDLSEYAPKLNPTFGGQIFIEEQAGLYFDGQNYITNCPPIYFAEGSDAAAITRENLGAVSNTGNQTISGSKNFTTRPTLSGLNLITTGDLVDLEIQISGLENAQIINSSSIVRTTGDQNISGDKNFIATNRLTISGLTSPTSFIVFGQGMFNVNGDSEYNTNAVLETYKSGNGLTDIKIQNVSTEPNSKAGLFLASPGNNVILYTTARNNNYRCIFSGSEFTNYAFESNNTRRLLISGNKTIIANATPDGSANTASLQTPDGITFPNIQVFRSDSNTLDDYEEGSWSPALKGVGPGGGATYTSRNGYYIKIGRFVYIHGRVQLSNLGGMNGLLYIDGLQSIINASSDANSQSTIDFSFFQNLATPLVNIYGHTNTTDGFRINLFKIAGAATTTNVRLASADITDTTDLIFAGNYRSAA